MHNFKRFWIGSWSTFPDQSNLSYKAYFYSAREFPLVIVEHQLKNSEQHFSSSFYLLKVWDRAQSLVHSLENFFSSLYQSIANVTNTTFDLAQNDNNKRLLL